MKYSVVLCIYKRERTFAWSTGVHIHEIFECTQEMRFESIRAQSDMWIHVLHRYSDIHNGPDSRRTLDMLFATLINSNDYALQMPHQYLTISHFLDMFPYNYNTIKQPSLCKIPLKIIINLIKLRFLENKVSQERYFLIKWNNDNREGIVITNVQYFAVFSNRLTIFIIRKNAKFYKNIHGIVENEHFKQYHSKNVFIFLSECALNTFEPKRIWKNTKWQKQFNDRRKYDW